MQSRKTQPHEVGGLAVKVKNKSNFQYVNKPYQISPLEMLEWSGE